jgi:hypothetical protein
MNMFLIGHRATMPPVASDLDLEAVAKQLRGAPPEVARCGGLHDFVRAVASAGAKRSIERLDILDHGAEGVQLLGNAILFHSSTCGGPLVGLELVRQIEPYLSDTAQVRLLGSHTAAGPAGRLLLLRLARALGRNRTVFGMIDRVTEADFDPDGFTPRRPLFSSVAALEREAPGATRWVEDLQVADAA